ncbi:unnamed protein product [Rotaria sp. Silwood1]|nr:unnamed protein product [Rotaria sp. Silwood1]
MYNDLMLFYSFYFFAILLLLTYGQQTIIYVKRGDTVELCDNRTTFIYAYEYRSFDGKKNLIIEPTRHERYSNPYGTSLLRINNVIENDSGQYKCPQDDIEWQKLQVYVPVQHVYLTNMHTSTHMHNNEFCGNENNNCLAMIEGEPLDIICAADGSPRPALDISLDKNGTIPTIMALANGIQPPPIVNDQFKSSVYEAYRIIGLIPSDNGRNITCQVDMKHIDKKLILSTTKQLYMEFRPSVAEKSKKIYCGINQTRTVNCTVIRANPIYIRYSINGLSSSIIHRTYGDQHDFYYTFDITPTSIEHFRPFNVTANNSIGFDTCTYELLHGVIIELSIFGNGMSSIDEKWPEPPAFIFMIDVSYSSVRSGLVEYICHILKTELLNYLPKDKTAETSNIRVGFATFDKQIHFYNIKNTLGQPQMMIVSDLEDIFVPLLDGFLSTPEESRGVINSLLDQIPQNFANSQETETILAPVIQSGIQALKEANCAGKIYIFSTTLPISVAPGKLTNRDDKKLLGTDKEKTLLAPVNNIYTKLGEECAQHGCAVDLFVFPNNYLDLATIGEVCRVSGGQIYKFNYFSIENDGERLLDELKRNFQRTTVFDALMRVRTSAGIRPIDFLGNFYMTNATEMIFGSIDSDKSVCVELKHDDKLPVESNTYIQAALLYTSISGQRRLRILTLALTVTSAYTTLYPACDLDTIMNYITKVAIRSITVSTPKSIRDSIITQAANMLACYRKNCAQSTTAGQLILPETLKLLPVYVTSLIKCDALTGTQTVTTDDRNLLMHRLMSMGIKGTFAYLYPRVYALHNLEEDHLPPPMIRCSYDRFSETGAYVLENGIVMYIWLGSQINPTFVQSLFGIQTSHIQPEKCRIVDLDNPISKTVRTLLNLIRNERDTFMKLFIIQQRDSIEPFFKNYLIEDKGFTGGASYVDFLYHLHREIRNILQ